MNEILINSSLSSYVYHSESAFLFHYESLVFYKTVKNVSFRHITVFSIANNNRDWDSYRGNHTRRSNWKPMIFCLDNSFDNPANKFLELFYSEERDVVENERGSRQEN
jgi:hypothetical protein